MRFVTSYVNPDLDGVACAVVFARCLSDVSATAVLSGDLNPETVNVLASIGLSREVRILDAQLEAPAQDFVLVDCHHPRQLPEWVRSEHVSLIIDHHPDGSPEAFPNATIQNEVVGSAATLVAEMLSVRLVGHVPSDTRPHLALLACAIVSNTLEFEAPSTTERDLRAYDAIATRLPASLDLAGLVVKMRGWRQAALDGSTDRVVARDVKVIECSMGRVAVSQLEAGGARQVAARPDVFSALTALGEREGCRFSVLSLVDTESGTTTLVVPDPVVRAALEVLAPSYSKDGVIRLDYLALRKSHLVPALQGKYVAL